MHKWKQKCLARAIQTYISEKKLNMETLNWQVDLFIVFMDIERKKAKIKVVKNIIL